MREYKFRGKRIDNGEWAIGSLLITDRSHYIIRESVSEVKIYGQKHIHWDALVAVDPETVGQYSTVKDLDGKEAFAGDIIEIGVQSPPYFQVVEFAGGQFRTSDELEALCDIMDEHFGDGFRVVGNIHEHECGRYEVKPKRSPHLLEQGEKE